MPRYFFHVRDSTDVPDERGVVLANADEARDMAVKATTEALRDLDGRFWNRAEWQMVVVDEKGASVCTLLFTGTKSDEGGAS
jgi:hypothetical protein